MYTNIYIDIILDKEVPTELLNDMQPPSSNPGNTSESFWVLNF